MDSTELQQLAEAWSSKYPLGDLKYYLANPGALPVLDLPAPATPKGVFSRFMQVNNLATIEVVGTAHGARFHMNEKAFALKEFISRM